MASCTVLWLYGWLFDSLPSIVTRLTSYKAKWYVVG